MSGGNEFFPVEMDSLRKALGVHEQSIKGVSISIRARSSYLSRRPTCLIASVEKILFARARIERGADTVGVKEDMRGAYPVNTACRDVPDHTVPWCYGLHGASPAIWADNLSNGNGVLFRRIYTSPMYTSPMAMPSG